MSEFSARFSRRQAAKALLLSLALWLHVHNPLLFSVNPLPAALLAATPDGTTVLLLTLSFFLGLSAPEGGRLLAVILPVTAIRFLFLIYRTRGKRRRPGKRTFSREELGSLFRRVLGDWQETPAFRGGVGFFTVLMWALWRCYALDYSYYALWGSLFLLLSALPLTFLLMGLFLPAQIARPSLRFWQGGAGALFLCASAYAGRSLLLWQIAPLPALSLALAFFAGGRRQFGQSLLLVSAGMGGYAPLLLPGGVSAVLLFALFRRFSRVLAAVAGSLCFCAVLWAMRGEVTTLSFLPTLLSGALGYIFCIRFADFGGRAPGKEPANAAPCKGSSAPVSPSPAASFPSPAERALSALQNRLCDLSAALSGLAGVCRGCESAEENGKGADARLPTGPAPDFASLYDGMAALLRETVTRVPEGCTPAVCRDTPTDASDAGWEKDGESGCPLSTLASAVCRPAPGTPPVGSSRRHVPCGDTVRFIEGRNDTFFALLCDGMGSGADAARLAGVCAAFTERLLQAGVTPATALFLLNQYLCARSRSPAGELTCALDLLEISRGDGAGRFFKCGAAASVVLRGDVLFFPTARTLPLGILGSPDVQCLPFSFLPGDRILLLSDGITEGASPECTDRSEAEFLRAALSPCLSDAALSPVALLLAAAEAAGSRDDRSVALVEIKAR